MANIAAMIAKHSVQTFMSVTRLRRGRLAWQQEPSVSICHDSGRSSHISTYSFPTILFTNFGGTEPKPAIIGRSADRGGAMPDVDGAVTAAGHGIAGAGAPPSDETNGYDQVVPEVAPPLAEAVENVGRDPTGKHKGGKRQQRTRPIGRDRPQPPVSGRWAVPRQGTGRRRRGHPGAPRRGRSVAPLAPAGRGSLAECG